METGSSQTEFSQKEKELVALGASVAAGCVPCTRYHVKAGQAEGATAEEMTWAVETALGVKDGTRAVMRRTAREALGLPVEGEAACCSSPPDRLSALVSMAAAVAVNCPASFRRYLECGRAAGVGDDEVRIAVDFARMIRARASARMDRETEGGAERGATAQTRAPAAATAAPTHAPVTSCCGPAACR